jgi:hypothetical protein
MILFTRRKGRDFGFEITGTMGQRCKSERRRLFNYLDDNSSINQLLTPLEEGHEVEGRHHGKRLLPWCHRFTGSQNSGLLPKAHCFVNLSVLPTLGKTFRPVLQKNLTA